MDEITYYAYYGKTLNHIFLTPHELTRLRRHSKSRVYACSVKPQTAPGILRQELSATQPDINIATGILKAI
ncbi:hypothetical protein M8J77_015541 [Diaphorina citri]|nr:hypothetical protein M8J77_015541 [Diaphorina citri]